MLQSYDIVSVNSDKGVNMLEELLASIGLNAQEVKVYIHMLESGPITAGKLAKKIAVPRASVYDMLQKLHDKGVVKRSLKAGIRSFTAEPPEKITQLFQSKITLLEQKKKQFETLVPELHNKLSPDLLNPQFQIYEGIEGVQSALKDLLLYYDTETLSFWPMKSMLNITPAHFYHYLNRERIRNNLYIRAIWPVNQVVSSKEYPFLGIGKDFKREIRIAPEAIESTMGYWVYGNKVMFVSSKRESFAFIIESAELAQMQRTQFDMIWNVSATHRINSEDTRGFLNELHRGNAVY